MSARWSEQDLADFESRRVMQKSTSRHSRSREPSRVEATTDKVASAPSKYKNKKTEIDGITFDSKKEAARYGELRIMERSGNIKDLEMQVEFELLRTPIKMSYFADFTYYERRYRCPFLQETFWIYVVEDCKGARTREYVRKRKAMKIVHGILIKET